MGKAKQATWHAGIVVAIVVVVGLAIVLVLNKAAIWEVLSAKSAVTPAPAAQSLTEDKITTVSSFAGLPREIQSDLSSKYSQASVKSGLRWQISTASSVAVKTLKFANLVNKVSSGVLAAIEGGKAKVGEWLVEEVAKTLGGAIISSGTSSKTGDVAVLLYDTYKLNKKIADKTFKAITKSSQLSAEVAAWVLNAEMTYINNNVSACFSGLAKIDSKDVYVVGVDGENFAGRVKGGKLLTEAGVYDKGLKFYYLDGKTGQYKNYCNDIVSKKLQVTKK